MRVFDDPTLVALVYRRTAAALLLSALVCGAGSGVAGQGRGATGPAATEQPCPALADGQGRSVQGRGDPASVSTAFQRRCAQRDLPAQQMAPVKRGTPQAAAPALRVDPAWLHDHELREDSTATIERMSATVLTSGVVVWVLQSGFIASLLMLGVPLWRHVDLLPIVERAGEGADAVRSEPADAQDETALARVLSAGRAHSSGSEASPT
jgi:hypothetical protein